MRQENREKTTERKGYISRALSVLLAMLVVFSCVVFTYADEGFEQSEPYTVLEEIEQPSGESGDITQENEEKPENQDEVENENEEKPENQGEVENERTQGAQGTSGNAVRANSSGNLLKIGGHDTYMQGVEPGKFYPEKTLTRAEAAQIFYNLLVSKPSSYSKTFPDVPSGKWYAKPIGVLSDLGILGGYPDGTFLPEKSVTRAEFTHMLTKFFTVTSGGNNPFVDLSSGHWAYKSIIFASESGWINGFSEGGKQYFRPDNLLTRAQAVTILNPALGRYDADFAKNVDGHGFVDIQGHWAFKQIVEAAQSPISGYVIVTASALNLRSSPSISGSVLVVLAHGARLKLLSDANSQWYYVETISGTKGYVSSEFVAPESPTNPGNDGQIPGNPSGNSSTVTISATSASLAQYRTLYLTGTVDGSSSKAVWRTTNSSVATVSNGFVYAVAPGTAQIIVQNSAGDCYKICNVTVTSAEVVRFVYASENLPAKGAKFDLMAVTDTAKTAVKFVITGPSSATYETTSYTSESQSASNLPTNNVRVFEKSVTLNIAGTYKIKAYSKTGSSYSSAYNEFTLLVGSSADKTVTTTESRRASTEIIGIIADFEGFIPTVYYDTLAYNIPTVGYGYVVAKNTTFYNNLTKSEAMAMLVNTVNNGFYASAVENFRKANNLKMSQCQFDALTSFAYNLGGGSLNSKYDTFKVLLNSVVIPSDLDKNPYDGTVNIIMVSVYQTADVTSKKLAEIPVGGAVKISGAVEIKKTKARWYKISYGNVTGWTQAGNIGFKNAASMTRDLAYTDAITFGNNFVQWCNAGGVALWGLYYRRQAEAKLFSYANYKDASPSSAGYKVNPGYTVPAALR